MENFLCMLMKQQKRTNALLIAGIIFLAYENQKLNKRIEELELNRR